MKMKAAAAVVAAFAALAIAPVTSASASTTHTTEDVTGSVFSCATHTYTVRGEIRVVTHSGVDAQGREHLTFAATTTGVTAVDENGSAYNVVGTQWFGSNDTPNGEVATFTFHLQMVAPGAGTVDTVSLAFHLGRNGEIDHDSSTCVS